MRKWSSCVRYAYKRLLEGKKRKELKIESPQRGSETVEVSTEGRNTSTAGSLRRSPYNPWRVLGVAGLTALSPEGRKAPRYLSPLKPVLVSGNVGRTHYGRETLLPGGRVYGCPNTACGGAMDTFKRRDTNTPAPELCLSAQFG